MSDRLKEKAPLYTNMCLQKNTKFWTLPIQTYEMTSGTAKYKPMVLKWCFFTRERKTRVE